MPKTKVLLAAAAFSTMTFFAKPISAKPITPSMLSPAQTEQISKTAPKAKPVHAAKKTKKLTKEALLDSIKAANETAKVDSARKADSLSHVKAEEGQKQIENMTIGELKQELKANPSSYEANKQLGFKYEAAFNPWQASPCYENALKLAPTGEDSKLLQQRIDTAQGEKVIYPGFILLVTSIIGTGFLPSFRRKGHGEAKQQGK